MNKKNDSSSSFMLAGQDVVLFFFHRHPSPWPPVFVIGLDISSPFLPNRPYWSVVDTHRWRASRNGKHLPLKTTAIVPVCSCGCTSECRLCHRRSSLIIYWSQNPLLWDCMSKTMRKNQRIVVCNEMAFEVVISQWHCHRKSARQRDS